MSLSFIVQLKSKPLSFHVYSDVMCLPCYNLFLLHPVDQDQKDNFENTTSPMIALQKRLLRALNDPPGSLIPLSA